MNLRVLLLTFVLAAFASACTINDYCIGCPEGGDDGGDDSGVIDGNGTGNDGIIPPDACVPVGAEVCNGLDDDCNGTPDDNAAMVGEACGSSTGQCTIGVYECNNGVLECSGVPGSPEECDNIDNDCDTVVDDGNPEGGAPCGSDVGECQGGTTTCLPGGILDCVGDVGVPGAVAEICDGKDNDCDGDFDEDVATMGDCGNYNYVGECTAGTMTCVGGNYLCVGGQGPTFELCDDLDQDCDDLNLPHNGWDLDGDVRNCGACGNSCIGTITHAASEQCLGGQCAVAVCDPGFWDDPTIAGEDCLYACDFQSQFEACNNRDEDCDFLVDEVPDQLPPPICNTVNECAGTIASCEPSAAPPGVAYDCVYGPTVSTDTDGNIEPETLCDGLDNDCDGHFDESFPNIGLPCADNAGMGECQGHGHYQCDPLDATAQPSCVIDDPGDTNPPLNETACDNKDEDCDGHTDENPSTLQQWVAIGGGRSIMKYEASHPDATDTTLGNTSTYACSRADVQPWTYVTQPQAEAACASVGGRLCSEQEWHRACSVVTGTTYPFAEPAASPSYVFLEAEDYFQAADRTSGGIPRSWVPDYTAGYSGISAMRASPNTGGTVPIGNAATESPRLDFTINFAATGAHRIYVRMYANTIASDSSTNDDGVFIGFNTLQNITTAVRNGSNVVTVTTSAVHGLVVGEAVMITGVANSGFDGTFTIASVPTTTSFTYAQTAAAASSSGGTAVAPQAFAITSAVRSGGNTVTITTAAQSFVVGQTVTIQGVTSLNMNGTFTIASVPTTTTFTYASSGTNGTGTLSGASAYGALATQTMVSANRRTWAWIRAANINVPATGTKVLSVWMNQDGVKVDAIVTRTTTSTPNEVRANGGDWSMNPNPDTFVADSCNGAESGNDAILPEGASPACYAAQASSVFDLSGNVKEWALERLPGENPIRGGAYNNLKGGTTCANAFSLADDDFFLNNVGFRCCK